MAGFAIPDDFPLNDLVSQELTNVSIGRHHVRLLFGHADGIAVDIEAGFTFDTNDRRTIVAHSADLATGAGALVELLGKTVVAVNRRPNNELALVFSNRCVLGLVHL